MKTSSITAELFDQIVDKPGGDIGLKELHNQRLTPGNFPWKIKGGEAAFGRAVTLHEE